MTLLCHCVCRWLHHGTRTGRPHRSIGTRSLGLPGLRPHPFVRTWRGRRHTYPGPQKEHRLGYHRRPARFYGKHSHPAYIGHGREDRRHQTYARAGVATYSKAGQRASSIERGRKAVEFNLRCKGGPIFCLATLALTGRHKSARTKERTRRVVDLGWEFHNDIAFWKWARDQQLVRKGELLCAPIYDHTMRAPSRRYYSDASFTAIGGVCPELKVY